MLSNYVGNAGSLTREVGRTYWKKAMGSDYPLEIYNNKVYMDFHGDPGFYMYKFPNGSRSIPINGDLVISCNFALYTGNIPSSSYYTRDGGIRFGIFNSNNMPLTMDGLSNSGQIFRNYQGYTATLSPNAADVNAFALRIRSKDPTPFDGTNPSDLSNYGKLINTLSVPCYSNSAVFASSALNSDISEANNPLNVINGESINNNIYYYQFGLTIQRTSPTSCLISSSVKNSSNTTLASLSYAHNFTSTDNYYTFDNFVFRCNSSTVEQAIVKNLNIGQHIYY
jgi:hypothetical protein